MLHDSTVENENATSEEKALGGRVKKWVKEHDEFLLGAFLGGSAVGTVGAFLYYHRHPEEFRGYGGYRGRKKPEKKEGSGSDDCDKGGSDAVDVDADMNVDMMLSAPAVPGDDVLGGSFGFADTTFTLPTAQGAFATGLDGIGGFTEPVDDGGVIASVIEVLDAIG